MGEAKSKLVGYGVASMEEADRTVAALRGMGYKAAADRRANGSRLELFIAAGIRAPWVVKTDAPVVAVFDAMRAGIAL